MLLLEVVTILGFGAIAFQDLRERLVHWVLFPIIGILLATLHLQHTKFEFFLFFSFFNVLLITGILLILWLYTKYIKKKGFINTSFGLGDVLFLYAFALGFPTVTFILLFACSLCFSLLAFVILNYFDHKGTVPLAGLMGIFLGAIFLWNVFTHQFSLYLV